MNAIEPVEHRADESTPTTNDRGEAEKRSLRPADFAPHVMFSVDRRAGTVVVRVVNPVTKELVRWIPPEEFLEIRRRLNHYLGKVADERA